MNIVNCFYQQQYILKLIINKGFNDDIKNRKLIMQVVNTWVYTNTKVY